MELNERNPISYVSFTTVTLFPTKENVVLDIKCIRFKRLQKAYHLFHEIYLQNKIQTNIDIRQ